MTESDPEHEAPLIASLAKRLYGALRAGDEATLLSVLAADFTAHFADGMPVGGGRAVGPAEARDHWWAIGRAFRVAAEPEEMVLCADGRLLVRGTYRGTRRADRHVVEARFTHLWGASGGLLTSLEQVTDTARWGSGG